MTISDVLHSVADQVNAGALGPGVTASVSGPHAAPNGNTPRNPQGAGGADKPPAGSLPEKLLEKFRQHRGENDQSFWAMGDDIDEAVVESAGRLTQNAVYGVAVIEMEISRGEVRVLHETARSTDQALRNEFADVLTHSHYRILRYIDDRSKRRGYLRWCLESSDAFGGRPAPASVLAKKVQKEMGVEAPEPTVGELWEKAQTALQRVYDADPATLWRSLSAYVALRAGDPAAEGVRDDLRMAASELHEAAKEWGKAK